MKSINTRVFGFLKIIFIFIPILMLPSQLDLGSRLYEYKTRVQQGLLHYQVGIADEGAIKDALHWNWEHKLPFFFSVMDEIKTHKKNIYHNSPAALINLPLEKVKKDFQIEKLTIDVLRKKVIPQEDLLDSKRYPIIKNVGFLNNVPQSTAAYRIYAKTSEKENWNYAINVSKNNIINGIGIKINHSIFPRSTLNFSRKKYNFFAVTYEASEEDSSWYGLKVKD